MFMKNNFIKIFGLLMIAALFFFALPFDSATAQTTITVCDSGCDYTSIQDAIDAATAGDIIEVGGGSLFEYSSENTDPAAPITIDKEDLTLTTDPANPATLRDNGASFYPVIEVFADGVVVENFNLERNNATGGGQVVASRKSDVIIRDNVISGTGNASPAITIDHGLSGDYGDNVSNVQILRNQISGEFAWGFGIRSEDGPGTLTDLLLDDNNVDVSGSGVFIFTVGTNNGLAGANITFINNTFATHPTQLYDNTGSGDFFAFVEDNDIDGAVIVTDGVDVIEESGVRLVRGYIQPAIDAASAGDYVLVGPSTYVEEISIDKPLQIIGQGTDTIIQSPDEIEQLFGTSSHPIVLIQDTDDVTIENLIIDGAGKGNANQNFVGVAFSDAGGLLQDLTLTGIIDTPFSGAQHGVAVSAYNTDEITRSISLQDNTIVDFQKNAVSIIANETTPVMVDIQGNIITGAGANSVTAQNGIQVSATQADGTISNNTVTGIGYSGNGWVATSILTTGNIFGELLIDNNTITEAQMGVYVYDGVSMISNNTIEVEKIGDFSYGIIATDPPIAMPDPYGEESLEISVESTDTRALLPVSIVDNNITLAVEENGVDVDTWGILAYGGSTLFDLDLTVTGNIITGFDYGVEIYQAEDETGEIVSVEAHQNCIIDSQFYAMLSNADAITVNAINNFWGDPSGPFHPTLNPDGLGGEVSDDIDFEPWLDVCPLIEQPEVPFEYFLPLVLN